MTLLPFTLHDLRTAGKALVLSLCLLSSCAPQIAQLPAVPLPEDGPHDDPARDAQARLLKEAYRAFVQERYPTAVLFFRRFVDDATDTPRMAEARWWLARAYEQLGDYRAAMAQYRVVAAGRLSQQVNGTLYEGHALRRLDELRQLHADQLNGSTKQMAVRISVRQLPPMPVLTTWLQDLVQEGVAYLVIDPIGTQGPSEAWFNPDGVKGIVSEAHLVGLSVWLSLDVHQIHGFTLKPEWLGDTVSSRASEGASAIRPDIANSDYQSYLEEMIKALSRSKCDGLFLPARPVTGFAREFSGDSFRGFTSSFGLSLSPQQVFEVDQSADALAQERTVTYWRWVGWKALSYAKLAGRLRKVLREINPTATLLVEVHQSTLGTPLLGLEQYGEDIAELVQRTGGAIVVRRESVDGEALLEKLGQQLGTMDRVWVGVSGTAATILPPLAGLQKAISDVPESQRWNVLIMTDSAPAVP